MNILLLASHAVAEYDDIRMFHHLGYDVFAPGGYEDPSSIGEGIRPPLPEVPYHADLAAACRTQREQGGDPGAYIDWAKANLHPDVIDWADVIIVHHFVDRWIGLQWPRIRHKRVIWRTCGQSNPELERYMTPFVDDGLQVVRYSPAEARYFGEIGAFAGQTALIRFGKFAEDYGPWTGEWPGVINITQHMAQRGDACGYGYWRASTHGLSRPSEDGPPGPYAMPIGAGSDEIGGTGAVAYPEMLAWLARARAYLYTGTRPASYTLGLMEALLTGVPVVSIGARAWGDDWGGADLFEAATSDERTMRPIVAGDATFDDPAAARRALDVLLTYPDKAANISRNQRGRAVAMFGMDTVGPQWKAFLG